jgi:hypothetical protein
LLGKTDAEFEEKMVDGDVLLFTRVKRTAIMGHRNGCDIAQL